MAELPENFDVDDSTPEDYRDLIARIRERVRNPDASCHGLPILPPQQDRPTSFFDMLLTTYDTKDKTRKRSLRLRLRRDNLYLIAYRDEKDTQWNEIGNRGKDEHLIAGSNFLNFGGSYIQLGRVANRGRGDIRIGRPQLITATQSLLEPTTSGENKARALLVIIQMICEATRFASILTEFSDEKTYYSGRTPSDQTIAAENLWSAFSTALLNCDENRPEQFSVRDNPLHISTLEATVAIVALVLCRTVPKASSLRLRQDVDMALIPRGRPLLEILSVTVPNIDSEKPGELYGTVTATDCFCSYPIYDRKREDAESIEPGQRATINHPTRAISAEGEFVIQLDLKDRDRISPDDQISSGYIDWNPYDYGNKYDVVLTETIDGKWGCAAVDYIVTNNAAEALVTVILKRGDGENPADVYGTICSETSSPGGKVDLFRRSDGDRIKVSPNEGIPLLRSVLVVPMEKSLTITALLTDHDLLSPDDEIANGSVVFDPQLLSSVNQYIEGKYGKIEVRVTWM